LTAAAPEAIGLTFDDGPSKWTLEVLDLLARFEARATFFVIGRRVVEQPDVVRRIAAEGHEIGNHTWSHPALATDCDAAGIRDELGRASDAIADVVGTTPVLFRPPHYDTNDEVVEIAAELGLEPAHADSRRRGSGPAADPSATEKRAVHDRR